MTSPITSFFGKKTAKLSTPSSMICCSFAGSDLGVRLDDDLAGLGVDDIVERERAFEIVAAKPRPCRFSSWRSSAIADLVTFLPILRDLFFLVLDVLFGTHSDEVRVAFGFDLE